MIVCPERKFIFVKNGKVAGTSVEIWLSNFCGKESIITPIREEDEKVRKEVANIGPQNTKVPYEKYSTKDWLKRATGYKPKFENHDSFQKLKKWYPKYCNNFFSFCIERNPWDKAVSFYYYAKYREGLNCTLREFILSEEAYRISDWGKYTGSKDEVLVDYIIQFEDLYGGLGDVSDILDINNFNKKDLPKCKSGYNKSDKPYWEILDKVCKNRISIICNKEINLMGYEFGP